MSLNIEILNEYQKRHIGPDEEEQSKMLEEIGVASIEELIAKTLPADIRNSDALEAANGLSENTFLKKLKETAQKNKLYKTYIGMGFYNCITPSVILRNIFENPGWYTQYTPYQAEIAQGRLEALLNYQTMVIDLTGMEVANASLLDEATAAAEAMTMLYRLRKSSQVKDNAAVFLVSDKVFPHTIDVLKTRALPLDIELRVVDTKNIVFDEKVYGALIQYSDDDGNVEDFKDLIESAHKHDVKVAVAADLLSLTLLKAPGEMGADVVIGSSQRLGVPLGYGGPHAGFFATRDEYKRQIPGRIIGVSIDRHGNPAYRMSLQTREQHIRGEKATSNICTAQSLLAIMASMYGVYHGPEGLKKIAGRIYGYTKVLENNLKKMGYNQLNNNYFGTLKITHNKEILTKAADLLSAQNINVRYFDDAAIGISVDETTSPEDINELLSVFAEACGYKFEKLADSEFKETKLDLPGSLIRQSAFMTHPVFNSYSSETEMMRYIKKLENKDLALNTAMIPLGSCTMKLNPATAMIPVSWPEFSSLHPFVPLEQAAGYQELIEDMKNILCNITGFKAVSLQPNSGAQGEFTGLMVIRAYFKHLGQDQRKVVLIPSSAHGTNPASASMAGMKVVIVKCDEGGNVDVEDLKTKAIQYREELAAFMITYPSTHGVFEEAIREMVKIIHDNGGQVYMDGANMNAQVGLTSPGFIGADVCHLNLHKTFSIPHGGGGPGMGPIAVAAHLVDFLPGHAVVKTGGKNAISAVSATPWGSASILPISYAYMKMLGSNGMRNATEIAILNANYIRARLNNYYRILYKGKKGFVGHEMIIDLHPFKNDAGIEVEDVAKRLIDYGFHAPTVAWPVLGTMMIEPTESESKKELDNFCNAMIAIYHEVQDIKSGKADRENNVLKNAPHTAFEIAGDAWDHPYTRKQAAYPADYIRENKFWPAVARVNNTHGDRNLICSCPPIESYQD
ncbi:MAG: aminomethyl-transferring glycine dehydrogenase [Calditrichaeota bacterium]|nr:aminomethyl-transferring glycine dehydrogenase [Calditrichota bacterium]